MTFHSAVTTEVNRIRKSRETNDILDVSYKKLSDPALFRVEFWLKRIATYIVLKNPFGFQAVQIEVPRTMKSLLKRYICPSDASASQVYSLFQQWIQHLLLYYRPKNTRSTVLTVDCVDQSVMDPNGPLYPYLQDLLATRALPYLPDRKACDRRK
jgi:hypothetical protein